jgi:hypothetical protein
MKKDFIATRAFQASGRNYRQGDVYAADTPQKREEAALLAGRGLIASADEPGKGGAEHGRDGYGVPTVRGVLR